MEEENEMQQMIDLLGYHPVLETMSISDNTGHYHEPAVGKVEGDKLKIGYYCYPLTDDQRK